MGPEPTLYFFSQTWLIKSSYRPTLSASKVMPRPIIFDPGLGPAFNEPTWLNAISSVDLVLPIQSFLKSLSRTRLLPKWPNLSSVELSAPMKQLSWSKASLLSRLFELHFSSVKWPKYVTHIIDCSKKLKKHFIKSHFNVFFCWMIVIAQTYQILMFLSFF